MCEGNVNNDHRNMMFINVIIARDFFSLINKYDSANVKSTASNFAPENVFNFSHIERITKSSKRFILLKTTIGEMIIRT